MTDKFFSTEVFRLGEFSVDPIGGVISKGSETIQVQPKVIQLLLCLVDNYGQIVSKEYLLENVWPGSFVVDGALRRCVFLLRKALTDASGDNEILETIPRRGYRLRLAPERLEQIAHSEVATVPNAEPVAEAYRGLNVFESQHADIFFGRQTAITQVIQALDQQIEAGRAFALILGPSGTGKSSLARAGVLPALVKRCQTTGEAQLHTLVFSISQSHTDTLSHLAHNLCEVLAEAELPDLNAQSLAQLMGSAEDAAITLILSGLEALDKAAPARLLLVFDQFEELFTHDTVTDSVRDQIISVLYALARSGRVWILTTMRSEYYPQFVSVESLRFLKGQYGQVDLTFPGALEIADIVRQPARLAGLSFALDSNQVGLDQILIDEATSRPGSLPLLQFALRELEMSAGPDKKLTHQRYQELGSLEGCLSMQADRVFAELSPPVQAALPNVLQRLVIADPRNAGGVLKRTAKLSEFEDDANNQALINAFIDARLITSFLDKTNQEPSVQFTHEAVLEHWSKARNWAQENTAEIRFRGWLAEISTRWADDDRASHYLLSDGKPLVEATRLMSKASTLDDTVQEFINASNRHANRRENLRRVVSMALVALTITAFGLWQSAIYNNKKAQRATQQAEATTDFMVSVFEDADPGSTDGRARSASELLERARLDIENSMQDEPESRAAVLRALGETYVLIGQFDIADQLLKKVETLLPEFEDNNPRLAAQVLLELSGIRRIQNRIDESVAYLTRALLLANAAGDDLLIAQCLAVRGLLENDRQDLTTANVTFTEALSHLDKVTDTGLDIIKLRSDLYNNLGMANMQLGEHDKANRALGDALKLLNEHGLDKSAAYSTALTNMASLRRLQGRNAEAVELYDEGIALRKRMHGEAHPMHIALLANKVSAQIKLGSYAAAAQTAAEGQRIVASGNLYDRSVAALFPAKLISATWYSGATVPAEMIDGATNVLGALAAKYGDDHLVVAETRAAIYASQFSQLDATNQSGRERLCEQLADVDSNLSTHGSAASLVRGHLSGFFADTGPCHD